MTDISKLNEYCAECSWYGEEYDIDEDGIVFNRCDGCPYNPNNEEAKNNG